MISDSDSTKAIKLLALNQITRSQGDSSLGLRPHKLSLRRDLQLVIYL